MNLPSSFPLQFLWPEMLWLLLLIPLLVALYLWLLRRQRATALRLPTLSIVREALDLAATCAGMSRRCFCCWPWPCCCWRARGPWPW